MKTMTYKDCDFIIYWEGAYCGFVNAISKEKICMAIYDDAYPFTEGLAAVKTNGKWGFIDNSAFEVIKPIYDEVSSFSDGLAAVKLGKYGYINRMNEIIIPFQFYDAYTFKNGVAKVKEKHGYKLSLINSKGLRISSYYKEIREHEYGFIIVENELQGVINKIGTVAFPLSLDIAWMLNRTYLIALKDHDWNLINIATKNEQVLKYDDVYPSMIEGLARVVFENKWGLINMYGIEIIKPSYDYISEFEEDMAIICLEGKKGYANSQCKLVIDPIFDNALHFRNNLALVSQDNRCLLIDKNGDTISEVGEGSINESFYMNGFPEIKQKGQLGLVDFNGKLLTKVKYSEIVEVSLYKDRFLARNDNKWAIIDNNQHELTAFRYDDISGFFEGLAIIVIGDKKGFIDHDGHEVVSPVFEDAKHFSGGLACVKYNNLWGFINKTGRVVIDFKYLESADFQSDRARCETVSENLVWVDRAGNETKVY